MIRAAFPLKRPVMVVTDYPLQNEIDRDIKYSGASNLDLFNGLAKAGIAQKELNASYLSYDRPTGENFDFHKSFAKHKDTVGSPLNWIPLEHQKDCYVEETLWNEFQALLEEIKESEAKILIVAGKWSFFFLTGLVTLRQTLGGKTGGSPLGGLSKYRASVCSSTFLENVLIYPILPPVIKHRLPEMSPLMNWDNLKIGDIYKKITNKEKQIDEYLRPNYNFIFGTEFSTVLGVLSRLEEQLEKTRTKVSVDIETRSNTIDCIGISFSHNEAMCIPFSTIDSFNYWSEDEELQIVSTLSRLFKHPNAVIVGQNFSYDAQFLWKFWLGKFHAGFDTMIANHVMFNKMKKSLDILASVYCEDYIYWKDLQTHSLDGVNK